MIGWWLQRRLIIHPTRDPNYLRSDFLLAACWQNAARLGREQVKLVVGVRPSRPQLTGGGRLWQSISHSTSLCCRAERSQRRERSCSALQWFWWQEVNYMTHMMPICALNTWEVAWLFSNQHRSGYCEDITVDALKDASHFLGVSFGVSTVLGLLNNKLCVIHLLQGSHGGFQTLVVGIP